MHSVALINDRETGRPRGFGFIEVDDDDLQGMISALDGKEMGGRALKVNEAQDKPRGGGGGGYGGPAAAVAVGRLVNPDLRVG